MTDAARHLARDAERVPAVRCVLQVSDLSIEELLDLLEPTEERVRLDGGSYLVDIPAWRTHLATAAEEAICHAGGRIVETEWPLLWTDRHNPIGGDLQPPLKAALLGTDEHAALVRARAATKVPIVNATTDRHQPLHVLADLLTIRELFGRLRGLRVAFSGGPDAYRTSLVEAAVRTGVDLTIHSESPSPELLAVLDANRPIAQLLGGSVHVVDADRRTVGVDVVIGDSVPVGLQATPTHLPLHLTGAAADTGGSPAEGPRALLFHRQENLQRLIRRMLVLVAADPDRVQPG